MRIAQGIAATVAVVAVTKIVEKGIIASLFLFLLTSCYHAGPKWCLDLPREGCCQSGRLKFPAAEPCTGVNFEIIRSGEYNWGYLSVLSFAIPAGEDAMTPVTITAGDQSFTFFARRLEGCQKLLLPDEGLDMIINWLMTGHTIHICFDRYQTTLYSQDFNRRYKELRKGATSFLYTPLF